MKLVIVESPSKAKTIGKYLGRGYRVVGSGGHVRDLPEKQLGIDIENNFEPRYVHKAKMKKTISALKKEVKKADKVYLATDPDREGEAISWHLKESLKVTDEKARIVFNEISKKAVTEAIKNPREIDMKLVDAQQARRVLDRLVGYKVSPVISKKIKRGLSAGRVQSAALRMIIDREKEIEDFKPEEYWNLNGIFNKIKRKTDIKCEFADINKKKVKLTNKEQVDGILADLKSIDMFKVENIKKGKSLNRPKPPFTTSTMQQDATQKFNTSSKAIMMAAQRLYEGVEINGELTALVTYIRTDSVRVSNDAINSVREYITGKYGKEYLPTAPNFYRSKKSAQDAHEAIRPINLEITPDSLKGKIENNFLRLYRLIYERFVASQMVPAEFDTLTIRIEGETDKKYGFRLKGKTLKFAGHTKAYNKGDDKENIIPNFELDEKLTAKEFVSEQKFTKPPSRYSESTLVKAMEENGIGRPSTYATVISTLTKRFYVKKELRMLIPTDIGKLVCKVLTKYFPNIIDLNFTANMENQLDTIDEGNKKWQEVLSDFWPDFAKKIEDANADETKYKPPVEVSDIKCEKCGEFLVVRTGRYGKFYACPGFPKCRNIKPYDKPEGKCPKCGGDIYKKRSKKGRVFYGCNNYPDCDFMSWDLPAPYYCPECDGIMKIVKKDGIEKYECINKECKHAEIAIKNDDKKN